MLVLLVRARFLPVLYSLGLTFQKAFQSRIHILPGCQKRFRCDGHCHPMSLDVIDSTDMAVKPAFPCVPLEVNPSGRHLCFNLIQFDLDITLESVGELSGHDG